MNEIESTKDGPEKNRSFFRGNNFSKLNFYKKGVIMVRTILLASMFLALSLRAAPVDLVKDGKSVAYTMGAKDSKKKPAQTVCHCQKTDETIIIDGILNESIWRRVPSVEFFGITDGSKPPFLTEGKMVWDDQYLYVGFYFERSDIRCFWPIKDAHLSEETRRFLLDGNKVRPNGPWVYTESLIMVIDSFAKVFLDPDGDGSNYVEFHVNPGNNVFDAWYKQGYSNDRAGGRDRFPRVDWACPGLRTATAVDGTLNEPNDVDKGWSIEMAIPWYALEPFCSGACPPCGGDLWGGHLGRVYRDRVGGENQYWVWPFLEIRNCHLPDRYAKVIFEDNLPKFERLFGFDLKHDEVSIAKAAAIGLTDVCGKPSKTVIELCAKHDVNFYALVSINPQVWRKLHPEQEAPLQKMTPEQEARLDVITGKSKPVFLTEWEKGAKQPENWQVTDKQKTALAQLDRLNPRIQVAYQWGGEPLRNQLSICSWKARSANKGNEYKKEVWMSELLCFHDPRVLDAMKTEIKKYMDSFPGIAGVAFDGIGFQNYHDCRCPASQKAYAAYCLEKNVKPSPEAWRDFSLQSLVDFNNALVDYVHELDPKAKTYNHIWPVYLPEPLYGNRLKMDYCGQTAAWYFFWDPLRIEQYSRVTSKDAKKHWPNANGVAFIGYCDSTKCGGRFPGKSPAKIESELRAILKGGASMLMVCSMQDVIDNPDIAAALKKFMKRRK